MKYPVTLDIAEVDNLQTALDSKSPIGHNHVIGDVSGLQTALDGKSPIGHSHIIGDVTGLQTALDGKASAIHTHDDRVLAPDGYYYYAPSNGFTGTSFGPVLYALLLNITTPITITQSIGIRTLGSSTGSIRFGLYSISTWSNAAKLWESPVLDGTLVSWMDTSCSLYLPRGLYWLVTIGSAQVYVWSGYPSVALLGQPSISTAPTTGYSLTGINFANALPTSLDVTTGGFIATNIRVPGLRYK